MRLVLKTAVEQLPKAQQGAPLIALLQALDADVILSRVLEATPQQRRALALAAYGGNIHPMNAPATR